MPSNGQNFVKPSSGGGGGVGGWLGKLFGGISDDKRARQMAQIQYDLHEAKEGVNTREIGTRTTHKVATESAGELYVDKGKHRNNLSAVKANDRWAAKFARDNSDLGTNPMYVGNASISSKGVTRQKSATVRYPDSPNSAQKVNKNSSTSTKETTADVAVDSEGTATNIGKAGKMPPKKKNSKTSASTSTTGSSLISESSGNPTQTTKTSSTGGGLTEVNNSNVTTGQRSSSGAPKVTGTKVRAARTPKAPKAGA